MARKKIYIQWKLYIKTTLEANKIWNALYIGGLYMQVQHVQQHKKYTPGDL